MVETVAGASSNLRLHYRHSPARDNRTGHLPHPFLAINSRRLNARSVWGIWYIGLLPPRSGTPLVEAASIYRAGSHLLHHF